jgi:hypothetical protein
VSKLERKYKEDEIATFCSRRICEGTKRFQLLMLFSEQISSKSSSTPPAHRFFYDNKPTAVIFMPRKFFLVHHVQRLAFIVNLRVFKLTSNLQKIFFNGSTTLWGPRPPHCSRLHDHTLRHTTLGRTPLDEGSARRRDLYLTTHNTQKRQTSKPPAGFEPTIPASERPQTHALDCAATGIGSKSLTSQIILK